MASIYHRLKAFIKNVNIFESYPPSTDPFDLTNQRISTKVFIILFVLIIAILFTYISLIIVRKSETIERPSLYKYKLLYSKYGSSLTCFCSTVSISYKTFLRIEPIFHDLCSSKFVSSDWIDYLINASYSVSLKNDFRQIGPRIFQFLSDFCHLVEDEIINRSLPIFYSTKYVSASVEAKEIFNAKVHEAINVFKRSATNEFLSTFDIIRLTTGTNKLMSNLYTNVYSRRHYIKEEIFPLIAMEYSENCSCHTSYHCIQPMTIKNLSDNNQFEINGLKIGCYVIEAIMQSNLQCFYNSICLKKIESILNYSMPININILNQSFNSHPNSTIEYLIKQSMVDQWFQNFSYNSYYKQCRPSQCIIIHTRNDLIYIVTFIIGIYGGITSVLMIIIPPTVKFIRRKNRQITSDQTNLPIISGNQRSIIETSSIILVY